MTRRILHVSMPTAEGVAVVALSYIRDQVARGWDVSVACPSGGWLGAAARAAGARSLRWEATRSPGPATLGETRRLAALVRDVQPDVVHLHSSKAGLAGRLAIRGRCPTVFQPHAWSFHAVHGALRAATLGWERVATRWTDALVLVSEAEHTEGLRARVRARSWVVPNGVDLAALPVATAADRASARARLDLPDVPIAVCIGRLCEQKGQRDLFAAWPAVRALVPDAVLVLVGDGPDRELLARAEPVGVRMVGARTDVPDWLAAATVVVAPSRWEGMALAPIEAMARSRYVVATDVAGMREALATGGAVTVPAGRREPLAATLAGRLADPVGTDDLAAAGRRHVEHSHDASVAAATVARIYERLS